MPSLNFNGAPIWLQWVIAVIAVITFVGAGVRLIPPVWRFVSQFVTTGNALNDLPAELEAQRQFRIETRKTQAEQIATLEKQNQVLVQQNVEIAVIRKQLFPNGGTTLRDDVVVIKSKLATDNERLNKLEGKKDDQS